MKKIMERSGRNKLTTIGVTTSQHLHRENLRIWNYIFLAAALMNTRRTSRRHQFKYCLTKLNKIKMVYKRATSSITIQGKQMKINVTCLKVGIPTASTITSGRKRQRNITKEPYHSKMPRIPFLRQENI